MKKKLIAILALCSCLALGGALTACTDKPEEQTHTQHVDANGDGVCDECGADMGGSTVEPEEYELTDGVFNWTYQGREQLIKFYEDGTFYAKDMSGGAKKGTYKVGSGETLEYEDAGADFVLNDPNPAEGDPNRDEWKTTTSYIDFFEEDGTTPMVMRQDFNEGNGLVGYREDDPNTNRIAYVDDMLHNVDLQGLIISTRTLSHSPQVDFTIDDEMPIERARYMLAELPSYAEEGEKVQDFYIILTQNGFTVHLDEDIQGTYTVTSSADGETYALFDPMMNEDYGELVVSAGGTVTLTKADGTEIALVPYAEPSTVETIATLSGTTSVGETPIRIDLLLKDDDTYEIQAWMVYAGLDPTLLATLATGTYTVSDEAVVCTPQGGEAFSLTVAGNAVSGSWSGTFNGTTLNVTLTGELPSSVTTLSTLSGTTAVGETPLRIDLLLKSDGSFEMQAWMVYEGLEPTLLATLATGTYTVSDEAVVCTPQGGEAFSLAVTGDTVSGDWSGTFNGTTLNVTLTGDLPAGDVIVLKELTVTQNVGIDVEFTLSFLSDNTVTLTASLMGNSVEFTADWELVTTGLPEVKFSNASNGEFRYSWGAGGSVDFTWEGRLSENMQEDTTVVFNMPSTELAALLQ